MKTFSVVFFQNYRNATYALLPLNGRYVYYVEVMLVTWWYNGRLSDLRSWGQGFDFWSGHYQAVASWTTGKRSWYI